MEWERQRTYDFEAGKEAGIEVGKEMGIELGKEIGIEAGIEKKAIEDAIALLQKKVPPETIAECIRLPLEKVLELQKRIEVKG